MSATVAVALTIHTARAAAWRKNPTTIIAMPDAQIGRRSSTHSCARENDGATGSAAAALRSITNAAAFARAASTTSPDASTIGPPAERDHVSTVILAHHSPSDTVCAARPDLRWPRRRRSTECWPVMTTTRVVRRPGSVITATTTGCPWEMRAVLRGHPQDHDVQPTSVHARMGRRRQGGQPASRQSSGNNIRLASGPWATS